MLCKVHPELLFTPHSQPHKEKTDQWAPAHIEDVFFVFMGRSEADWTNGWPDRNHGSEAGNWFYCGSEGCLCVVLWL